MCCLSKKAIWSDLIALWVLVFDCWHRHWALSAPIRGDWWKLIRRSIPPGLALRPIRFLQMKLWWSPITVNASSKHPMSYSSESTMKSSPTHQTRRHSSSPSRACTRRLPGIATLPSSVHGARVRGRTHLVRSHRLRPPLTREKKIDFQSSITS